MPFVLELAKESFKFSGSHFTVFGPDHAERLHGHNYQVRVEVEIKSVDPVLGLSFDFNEIKPWIVEVCGELDERILLPTQSPHVKLTNLPGQLKVEFSSKTYSFPVSDVCLLPLCNITSEELARYVHGCLKSRLEPRLGITRLAVTVEETRGQSAQFFEQIS